MAITHVGSNKATGAASSLAVTKPAGATSGDVAIFVATADSSGNSITLPTGFTQIHNGEVPSSAVGSCHIAIGYKVLGGSEPSSYTVNFGLTDDCTASCHVWRGVNNTTVQDVTYDFDTNGTGSGTIPACPSLTTTTDGAVLLTIVSEPRGPSFGEMDFENYYQPPGGVTEVIDANHNAGSHYTGHAVGWETIATAGSTGTRTWSSIDNNDGGWAGSVALRPAVTSQTVNVGQATETSSAKAATASKAGVPTADITHVGSEKATGDGTSASVTKPAGATSGDVAVIVASADSSGNTITLPVSFTTIFNGDVPSAAVGAVKLAIGYRVLTGTEPSSWTVTFGVSDSYAVSAHVWRSVDNSTPQDVAFQYATNGTGGGTIPDCPSVTTVTDKAALITIVAEPRGPLAVDMDYENYYQPPVGTTEVIDANWSAGSGYAGHAVGWELITDAGSTGTRTWGSIDNDDGGFAGSLTLRPAATVAYINVGKAPETSAAPSVSFRQNTRAATATETTTALPLKQPRTLNIGLAQVTDAGTPVGIDQTGSGTTGYTDFTEYSVAQNLLTSDWTLEEGGTATLAVQDDTSLPWGRRVRFDLTNAGTHCTAVWNDAPTNEDWDVLILTRRQEAEAHVFGAAARWTAGDSGYIGGPIFNTTTVTIRRQTPSGTTTVLDASHRGITPTSYFWLRLRIRGTTTRLRVWQANLAAEDLGAANEPSDWDIDTTDSEISGTGLPGIHFRQVGTTNRTMDVGWFSFGSGQRIAPTPFSEKVISVGLATESSVAKVAADKLASRIDPASEADTANPVLGIRSVTLDKVTGTTAATGVTFELNLVVHTATETSTAAGILAPRTLIVGLASEAASATAATPVPATAVGKATETAATFALGGAKVRSVGLASESVTTYSTISIQTSPELINRARNYHAATPVTAIKTFTVGTAAEANAAIAAAVSLVRLIDVGLATETTSSFTVLHDRVFFVGTASEVPVATALNSGLPPFWWRFYDQADGKPSKRRLRPLVFTDEVDGKYYIIMRNETDNLIRLEPFTPQPYDEVYSEYGGPTIEKDGRLYRLYVSGGVLRFERSLFEVRTRPILFGKVARPTPRQPRYELVMLTAEP